MCAGRIIADSDDDDDFSPVPSPVKIGASSTRSNIPDSLDPGSFRSDFLAQQEAQVYDPGPTADAPSDSLPDGGELAARGGGGADTYDPWAIMSSPDALRNTPKTNKARSKVSKTYSKKEGLASSSAASLGDTASIATPKAKNATPSKPAKTYSKKGDLASSSAISQKDTADTPTAEAKNAIPKVSRTYSKKNPGANDSASSPHDVIDLVSPEKRSRTKRNADEDGSPLPAKRKRISDMRVGDAGSLEEGGVDTPSFLEAPDNSMAPPERRSAHDGPSGGSGQLSVLPSKMTASQMDQYEEVNIPLLSSLDEPDLGQFNLAMSSGAATIAYPTPTQYRQPDPPSLPPPPPDPSPAISKKGSRKRRLSSLPPTADNPSSSPDVFTGAPDDDKVQPKVGAGLPIMEVDNSCDEDWNETDHGFPKEREWRPTRSMKRQRAARQESMEVREDNTASAGHIEDAEAQERVDPQPVPKKRGRKRKETVPDPDPVASAAEVTQATEASSQKRGWKKKDKAPDPEPVVSAAEETQAAEDASPQKRVRKKKDRAPDPEPVVLAAKETQAAEDASPQKRGRKKKDKAPDPEPVASAEVTQATEDAPPQKRKRGRPKKSDKVGSTGNVPAKEPEPPEEVDHGLETRHDVEDGSAEAGCRDTDAKKCDEQDNRESAEADAKMGSRDDDVSPRRGAPANTGNDAVETSAAGPGGVSTGKGGEGGPAMKARADALDKAGGLQRPGAKQVYRVGLSRRSRITPLLKCIRKD